MTSYEQPGLFPDEELSPPGGPARATRLRGVAAAWLTHVRDCGGTSCDSWLRHVPVGSSARTSLGSFRSTTAATSGPSSGTWMTSGMAWRGEFWTLNGSESPSAAVACSLPDVLETGPHLSRYSLSPRAATGILRRAARRGRVMPADLQGALENARTVGTLGTSGPGGGWRVGADEAAAGQLVIHPPGRGTPRSPDRRRRGRRLVT